jgi:hypothetical protein
MPWKQGESGNPGGRPKDPVSLTAQIKERLSASRGELAGQIADALIGRALMGDLDAIKVVLDRAEGKVPQVRQVEESGETTIRIIHEERKLAGVD